MILARTSRSPTVVFLEIASVLMARRRRSQTVIFLEIASVLMRSRAPSFQTANLAQWNAWRLMSCWKGVEAMMWPMSCSCKGKHGSSSERPRSVKMLRSSSIRRRRRRPKDRAEDEVVDVDAAVATRLPSRALQMTWVSSWQLLTRLLQPMGERPNLIMIRTRRSCRKGQDKLRRGSLSR